MHDDHLPLGKFILEGVVINFRVVAADHQVVAAARKLKRATRVPAMARTRRDFFAADTVRELEAFDDDIGGRRFQMKTFGAVDFNAADGLRLNGDWPPRGARPRDAESIRRGINTVREHDVSAGGAA